MPTVRYTKPQQGFRPHTNPLGALNAYGRRSRLKGIGSLGDPIADQSVVIYQGKWQTTYTTWNPMDVVSAVAAALAGVGLTVRNESVNAPTAAKLGLANIPFSITLTLQVTNGLGFGDPNDINADIAHAVYQATGYMPLAGSIVNVSSPSGGTQATGQPTIPTAPDVNCAMGMPYDVNGNPCPGPSGAPQTFTQWVESNAIWIGLGVVAAVVLPPVLSKVL